MATGQEILSYQGSGGLGSSPGIPVSTTKDLDAVNQAADRLVMMNAAQNQQIFQQKIKERDQLLAAIDSGEISVGDLLDDDMPFVQEGLKKLDDAYFNRIKKGVNDLEATREYNKSLRDSKDRVTQAQARKLFYDTESAAIAKDPLTKTRGARKAHLDKVMANKWGDLTPFVPAVTVNFEGIKGLPKPVTVQLPADKNRPYETGKRTYVDFEQIKRDTDQKFLEDQEGRQNQVELFNSVQKMPANEAIQWLTPMVRRIGEYNQSRGLTQGQPGYADISDLIATDQTGKPILSPQGTLIINKSVPEFSALWALSTVPNFVSEEWEVEPGKLNIAKHAEDVRSAKAREANDRSRLGLDWSKFNYATSEDKFGASSVINEAKDIIDKGEEVKVDIGGGKTKTVLRIGDPTLLKQFGNIDKDGNVTNVPDVIEYDRDNDQVKLVYYEGVTKSGKNRRGKEVSLDQRTWLKEIAKRSFPNKDIGKVNTLVDDILTQNGNSLYKITQRKPEETPKDDLRGYDIPKGAKVVYGKDGKVLGYELKGQKFKF